MKLLGQCQKQGTAFMGISSSVLRGLWEHIQYMETLKSPAHWYDSWKNTVLNLSNQNIVIKQVHYFCYCLEHIPTSMDLSLGICKRQELDLLFLTDSCLGTSDQEWPLKADGSWQWGRWLSLDVRAWFRGVFFLVPFGILLRISAREGGLVLLSWDHSWKEDQS